MKLDDRGRPIEDLEALEKASNVLIVDPTEAPAAINRAPVAEETPPADEPQPAPEKPRKRAKSRKASTTEESQ
jgi:hypothetical protein